MFKKKEMYRAIGKFKFNSFLCSQLLAIHHDILDKEKQNINLVKEQ